MGRGTFNVHRGVRLLEMRRRRVRLWGMVETDGRGKTNMRILGRRDRMWIGAMVRPLWLRIQVLPILIRVNLGMDIQGKDGLKVLG